MQRRSVATLALLAMLGCQRDPTSASTPTPTSASTSTSTPTSTPTSTSTPTRTMQVLAREQNHPRFVALHGDRIVFTEYEGGTVRQVPKAGGAVTTLLEGAEDAYGVAVIRDAAFVAARTQHGVVWRIPLDLRAKPTRLALEPFPSSVATDGNVVAWTTRDSVVRARHDGRERIVVAKDQAGPHGLVVTGEFIAWSNYHDGSLVAASTTGTTVRTLATGLVNPAGLALAGQDLVVACTGDGTLRAVPRRGGATRTLARGLAYPSEVAVADAFVYFTAAGGVVGKVPLAGGEVVVLAQAQPAPTGIAVDETAVYWADDHAGTIVKLSPK